MEDQEVAELRKKYWPNMPVQREAWRVEKAYNSRIFCRAACGVDGMQGKLADERRLEKVSIGKDTALQHEGYL